MIDKLLPCPFCGGEAERLELTDEENFGGSVISCKSCGASSPVHFGRKENLDDSWNSRKAALSDGDAPAPEAAAYAERLAISLWEKHWKDASPEWKPLSGDLIGILTQIDNMTAGLTRTAPAPVGQLVEALREIDTALNGVQPGHGRFANDLVDRLRPLVRAALAGGAEAKETSPEQADG